MSDVEGTAPPCNALCLAGSVLYVAGVTCVHPLDAATLEPIAKPFGQGTIKLRVKALAYAQRHLPMYPECLPTSPHVSSRQGPQAQARASWRVPGHDPRVLSLDSCVYPRTQRVPPLRAGAGGALSP